MTRACIGISLLLAMSASAQTTGSIAGRILDAETDRPVAGAVVVASSPALQGEQTARTDAEGEFEIGLLPAGEYVLNVQAEAHQAFTQERLAVHAGRSIRLNLKIIPDRVTAPVVRFAQQIPTLPVAGALIGGAIYFLDTPREHPERIGYWAAGGVLVGTGIGIINVVADENRAERAVANRLPSDPVPTYRVSLLQTHF